MNTLQQFYEQLTANEILAILAIAAAMLLWLMLRAWLRQKGKMVIAFENQKGQVKISQKALGELVQRICLISAKAEKCSPKFRFEGKTIHLEIFLHLRANRRLSDIKDILDEQISQIFREHLGIESLGHIDIVVSRFVGEPQFPTTKKISALEGKMTPFAIGEDEPLLYGEDAALEREKEK